MRTNWNKHCDSNILTFFRNGVTWCDITPIIVSLIAFDLIYVKFSERYPNPCLVLQLLHIN